VHVVFITEEYPPLPSGGIGTSIRGLARALVSRGHRTTVLGWGQSATFDDRGVHVHFLGRPRIPGAGPLLRYAALQREVRRLSRDGGIDVIEAPDSTGPSAGLRVECPVVVRCHGSSTYFHHLLGSRVRPSVAYLERWALREARSVAAVSRFAAQVTERLFELPHAVHVIPNGIDVTQFEPQAEDGLPSTVLYVGTVTRKKGILDLCRMFSLVAERDPSARLVILGRDVPDAPTGSSSTWALCQAILSPVAAARTRYLGELAYDRVQEILRTAVVCVFPSYAETLGNAWLEAMCCAKPVIAYDIGWAPEVVDSGVTGLLVAPGDIGAGAAAIEELLADPARARALGSAGRDRAHAHFSVDVAASRTLEWYRLVLSGGR
jgi:glycosyltransferase involved in cell wall biosynthesis